MGKKATPSPGATAKTPAVPDAPITGLRWTGPGYLAVLGQRDHSVASLTIKGVAVYARAVASGWYTPTDAPARDRGLPAVPPEAPPPATTPQEET